MSLLGILRKALIVVPIPTEAQTVDSCMMKFLNEVHEAAPLVPSLTVLAEEYCSWSSYFYQRRGCTTYLLMWYNQMQVKVWHADA